MVKVLRGQRLVMKLELPSRLPAASAATDIDGSFVFNRFARSFSVDCFFQLLERTVSRSSVEWEYHAITSDRPTARNS